MQAMKTLRIFATALTLPALLALCSCTRNTTDHTTDSVPPVLEKDTVTGITETRQTATGLTKLFADNVGKYVRDIEFFTNADLKAQLTALLGKEKLERMQNDWQTQTPIQFLNGCYVTGGMKNDSGANPGFTIVYNPELRNLSVAWVDGGKTDIYQQQKEDISSLVQFPAN